MCPNKPNLSLIIVLDQGMSSKQKLKAAKEALDSKEFDKARNAIESILTFEPMNYNANVFHGLALFNLGDDASAEKVRRLFK